VLFFYLSPATLDVWIIRELHCILVEGEPWDKEAMRAGRLGATTGSFS
jgi:hypothetical protein